jgi:hypothetical protein
MLGCGFNIEHTFGTFAQKAHNGAPKVIILDSSSTDSGPEELVLGTFGAPRESHIRGFKKLVKLSWQFRVSLVFSSAGVDESDEHVCKLTAIEKEICKGDEK